MAQNIEIWDDIKKQGVDTSQMVFILLLDKYGLPIKEGENAKDYVRRLDDFDSDILKQTFKDRELGIQIITKEIDYFHESLHKLRVHKGLVQPQIADAFLILVACRKTGVRLSPEDTGTTFRERIHAEVPGLLNYIAKTPEHRDLMLDRAVTEFRQKVREGRISLICACLLMVLTALVTLSIQEFGVLATDIEGQVLFLLKLSLVSTAGVIYFAFRMRHMFARVEAQPVYL